MATYYNKIDLDASIAILERTKFKVGYSVNSFNDVQHIVSIDKKVIYQTYSTAQLHAYCMGLVEGLKY